MRGAGPDVQRALHALVRSSPQFDVFVGWLQAALDESRVQADAIGPDTPLRWQQGQSQTLASILAVVEKARA